MQSNAEARTIGQCLQSYIMLCTFLCPALWCASPALGYRRLAAPHLCILTAAFYRCFISTFYILLSKYFQGCTVNAKGIICRLDKATARSVWQTSAPSDSLDFGVLWSQFHLSEFINRIIHDMHPIPPWRSCDKVKTMLKRAETRTHSQKNES